MLIKYTLLLLISICLTRCFANITSLPNSQTKNLKGADLAEVQLQDVEAYQKENKLNEKGERILRRKIAPTDSKLGGNTTNNNGNETVSFKIATEGAGVTKLTLVKDSSKNDTISTAETIVVTASPVEFANSTKIAANNITAPIGNSTAMNTFLNGTTSNVPDNHKSTSAPPAAQNTTNTYLTPIITPSTKLNTSSTTTTTTSTTTTTTTTTPKPKKPTITYSIEDMPEIANVVPQHSSSSKFPTEPKPASPKLSVEEPEQPIAQLSQEFDGGLYRNHRDYIIPIVSIIFAVPILMGMVIVAYRRFRDFWSTRHYRRMDFLVDGMYND